MADHYNNDVERSEVACDLSPLPLLSISVEDGVDVTIYKFEDYMFVLVANFVKTG